MTTTNGTQKHRKSLKEHLEELTQAQHGEEAEALRKIRSSYSGKRAAKILAAPYQQLLDAGITNASEHPDVKAALASRKPDAAPSEGKKGRAET